MQKNNKYLLLTLIFSMSLLAGFGIDLYAPSLPAMALYFHTGASNTQLALAIYLLGFGMAQPVFGTLSDCCGRKIALLIGTTLYVLATVIAAFAHSIVIVIIMRLLQGVGGAATSSVNKAMVMDSFPPEELPKYAAFMTICWGLGPVIAPVIGGYLQHCYGWQSNFIFQSVQSALVLLFVILLFKETNHNLITFDLPIITKTYLTIISHTLFIGSVLLMALMYSLIIIFNVMSPFLIQVQLHYSAIQYGHIALIIGLAYFLGTLLNRVLLAYYSPDKLIMAGIAISVVISVVMSITAYIIPMNLLLITIPSFLLFLAGGVIFPNGMAKSMALFREYGGAASAVTGCLFVICTFFMSYVASLLNTTSVKPMSWAYLILVLGYVLIKFTLLRPAKAI
jgi:Bcr/CflA subfamily drug resistance transporter